MAARPGGYRNMSFGSDLAWGLSPPPARARVPASPERLLNLLLVTGVDRYTQVPGGFRPLHPLQHGPADVVHDGVFDSRSRCIGGVRRAARPPAGAGRVRGRGDRR